MQVQTYCTKKIGVNRSTPRLWMEGKRVEKAGFVPGAQYVVEVTGHRLTLRVTQQGSRVVSSKKDGERVIPVIDLNSFDVLGCFVEAGFESVRVVMRVGCIHILPLVSDLMARERLARVKSKLERGDQLDVGSISHGGGVMSLAMHQGLERAGVANRLAFAIDIDADMLDQADAKNPCWDQDTQYVAAPVQEVAFDSWAMERLSTCDIFEIGIPCSGASVAGRAKRGLSVPEDHPEVGYLVAPILCVIHRTQPLALALECVKSYLNSGSMAILRGQLGYFGYTLHETVLRGADFNALEDRERMVVVAVSRGVSFDFDTLPMPERVELRLGDVLEDVPDEDPSWSLCEGLRAKEERDKAAGKGFQMQFFGSESPKINTLTKGLQKARSTDCRIQHPTNPALSRLPTVNEHAACKGIPPVLVEGTSKTFGHMLLGQSVIFPKIEAVAFHLGSHLKRSLLGTDDSSDAVAA